MTVAVASAVAFLAIGAVNGDPTLPTGTSFEERNCTNLTWNALVGRADDGVSVGDLYWYASPSDFTEEMGVISNYNGDAYAGTRPDKFAAATQNNFLSIETSTPLFRTVYPYNGEGGTQQVAIATGEGLYLDTLVKFTAADAAFGTNSLDNADKIAISYVAYEPEHPEDVNDVAYTNFVICAGYIGANGISQTNYLATITNGTVDLADWHRLTVRTLTNIDGHDRVGFKVYVDEKELVYLTDDPRFATAAGAEFADATRTIFPSVIDTDRNNYNTISSVAFSGNGSIDDLSFTSTMPQFIKNTESVVVAFTKDSGVTAISVQVGEAEPIAVDMTAATLVAALPPATTAFTVTATIDEANGYTFAKMTVGDGVYTDNPASITGYAGEEIAITTARNNFNLFDENGDPIQGTFQTLSEALAADDVAKIALAWNYQVTAEEAASEQEIYTIDGNIVLDLNGKTLDGGEGNGFELFYVTGSLKVIDSVGGGKIVYGGNVFGAEGSLLVGDVSGDNGVTIDGVLFNDQAPGYIIRANVLAEDNTDTEDAFLWEGCLGDGEVIESEANLVGDYWVVTPQNTPQPTTYEVTWTLTGGSASATSGDNFEEDDTIVFTADSGKTLSYLSIDGVEDSSEYGASSYTYTVGTADAELVVTFTEPPAPIGAYEVIVTPAAKATYSAICTNDNSEVTFNENITTVAVHCAIMITAEPAEGYEYATTPTGWTAGQGGEITIVVDAAGTVVIPEPTEKSGKTYPSYISDDATEKGKYDAWATYAEISPSAFPDATGANQDAYLLNCKPSEVAAAKAAFKFTSISYDTMQSKWVTTTTTSYNERAYNGTVVVKQYSNVGCTTESETGNFFKASLQ